MSFRTWFVNLQVARTIDCLRRDWRQSPRRRHTAYAPFGIQAAQVETLEEVTPTRVHRGGVLLPAEVECLDRFEVAGRCRAAGAHGTIHSRASVLSTTSCFI